MREGKGNRVEEIGGETRGDVERRGEGREGKGSRVEEIGGEERRGEERGDC